MSGYSSHNVGRSIAPESGCGETTYACFLTGFSVDPLGSFGGMYEKADVSKGKDNPNRVNPLTGGFDCPNGYRTIRYGRVLGTPKEGANQYYCESGKLSLSQNPFGGFYQITDGGKSEDHIPNFYTQTGSCPTGFRQFRIARQKAPEAGGYGASQYICLKNVMMS